MDRAIRVANQANAWYVFLGTHSPVVGVYPAGPPGRMANLSPTNKSPMCQLTMTTPKKTTRKKVQKKVVKAKGKAKEGRPRSVTPKTWTSDQIKEIDEKARAQCKDTTIASALGVDVETFRREFRVRTEQKRAEGKCKVLLSQYDAATGSDGSATDRIWFGKQHLGQKDKQEVDHGVTDAMGELMRELDGTAYNPGNGQPTEREPT